MAEGRGKLEWGQTSQVLAMLYNANRSQKHRALRPDDFNPYDKKIEVKMKVPLATAIPAIMEALK